MTNGAENQEKASTHQDDHQKKKWCNGPWWFQQNDPTVRLTGWLTTYTFLLVIVAGLQFCALEQTDQRMRDQLTLTFPPRIKINNVHIWDKGAGSVLNPNNKEPTFIPGTTIDGAVFALNSGREYAYIIDTYCELSWIDKNTMPPEGITWYKRDTISIAKWHPKDDIPLINSGEKEIAPGAVRRWELEKDVPETVSQKDLFVIGYISYQDRLKTRRAIYFARKYDPATRRFFPVGDPENEGEE
ncbi:MAG: hypothetical protein M3178_05395 [Pseudomonadota bacterium]|nr:hypothetical protein [Pseudomonadota bacterium]